MPEGLGVEIVILAHRGLDGHNSNAAARFGEAAKVLQEISV
jgi:hypothetical protein